MSKYNRHQPVVSRQSDNKIDEENWLSKLQKNLVKDAVQPKSVDNYLFHQINSIMNGKSKYPSVEAAVEDMMERSGVTAHLANMNKTSKETSETTKVAEDKDIPIVIKNVPSIRHTLENYIRDTKGNLPIPAIIDKVKSIHRNDISEAKDWDDDKLMRLISRMNLEAKRTNSDSFQQYQNLGSRDQSNDSDIDPSNLDAFHALNPVKL